MPMSAQEAVCAVRREQNWQVLVGLATAMVIGPCVMISFIILGAFCLGGFLLLPAPIGILFQWDLGPIWVRAMLVLVAWTGLALALTPALVCLWFWEGDSLDAIVWLSVLGTLIDALLIGAALFTISLWGISPTEVWGMVKIW